MIKYSVVVCTYNGEKTIEECILSLLDQDIPKEEYKILVIDDGSTDNTKQIVKNLAKNNENLRLISQNHKGLSVARNLGFKQAKGDIVLYIDDDAVADKDWIRRITNEYSPDIDGVGGYSRPYISDSISLYEQGRGILIYGKYGEKVDGAGGLNMSFRKKILYEIGGFDQIFTSVADDADMNKRLNSRGYRLKVVASITVRHRLPTTIKDFCRKKISRGRGNFIFMKKYRIKYTSIQAIKSLLVSFINIPSSIYRGYCIAKIQGKKKCIIIFAFLNWLEGIITNIGLISEYLKNKKVN